MSNKTLKAAAKKTASAPKSLRWLVAGVVAIVLVSFAAIAAALYVWPNETTYAPTTSRQLPEANADKVCVDDQCVPVETVSTPAARQQGLSDRDSLPRSSGMLFVFESPQDACFWMKDMRFSIDMVWIDSNKRVVKIMEDVSPETYPESFCPESPAQYVLEVNSGDAKRNNITVGSRLDF